MGAEGRSVDSGDLAWGRPVTRAVADPGHLEREVKLGVDLDFVLPDLTGDVGTPGPPHGAGDAHGLLRYGGVPAVASWHDPPPSHRRRAGSRDVDGQASGIQPRGRRWTARSCRGPDPGRRCPRRRSDCSSGSPAAHRCIRSSSWSRRGVVSSWPTRQGRGGGELDDDTVTVAGGNRDGVCFRQIEVELGPGGDELAGRVVRRLLRAGARPGGEQKLAKAVDLPAHVAAGGSDPKGLADGGRRRAPASPPRWTASSTTTTYCGSTPRIHRWRGSTRPGWPPAVCARS